MSDKPRPVHLYVRIDGQLSHIGCGKAVSSPGQYTTEMKKASCRTCAVDAPGLTQEQRQEIWDNRNDALGTYRRAPWQIAADKKTRAEEKKRRATERDRRRQEREQKREQRRRAKASRAA